jgi:hypothetical protein
VRRKGKAQIADNLSSTVRGFLCSPTSANWSSPRVIYLDAEIPDRALDFRVAKQELHGTKISRAPVDEAVARGVEERLVSSSGMSSSLGRTTNMLTPEGPNQVSFQRAAGVGRHRAVLGSVENDPSATWAGLKSRSAAVSSLL